MSYKKFSYSFLVSLILFSLFTQNTFAVGKILRSPALGVELNSEEDINRLTEDVCGFTAPEEKIYKAQIISVRNKLKAEKGETFEVKVFMKNTGNMPWFSKNSECPGPKMSLGTDKERDHSGVFYAEGLDGWEAPNRIAMDQYRTDPGQIASFSFSGYSGDKDSVYKEYYAPVLEAIQWIDDAAVELNLIVGEPEETATDLRKKMVYATVSGSLDHIDLEAPRTIVVDRSDQTMFVKLGDYVVREFKVSTGAYDTPTPLGETTIKLKQEVRIGGKAPHYVMPKFQLFREGGYGLHALPSLRNDRGIFWTEALNHIGRPVSHGCIRLLPEDADFLFDFTEIGDKVVVQK